mgnify:CR=1 FL=1
MIWLYKVMCDLSVYTIYIFYLPVIIDTNKNIGYNLNIIKNEVK